MTPAADALSALLGRVTHLEGPMLVLVARVLVVILTILLAVLAYRLGVKLVDRLLRPLEAADYSSRLQRVRTLDPLLKNVIRYSLAFIAIVIVLREFGVDVQAILVSAGVVGLAVGLGAQTLIRDVITGVFLLFEGLISVGDVVEVGPTVGTVESIGLRVTRMRLLNGAQRIIPNGELTQFTNYTKGWPLAVVDISLSYKADVRRALQVLERVGQEWLRETGQPDARVPPPGIVRFGDANMVLRLTVPVAAARRFEAELDLRRRVKEALEAEAIPFP